MKQYLPTVSIDEGTQIDARDEQAENAEAPRAESLEPGANVTCERTSHESKQ
jgi:hypothetical protein